eukprot:TRINITY_DN11605_c0_g1_i1.p1 TRINITY_DN11605_c0_g1~~TRINITY_DN11605_c0_g1_i1.p1  ORF type:complete len:525 (-),score=76.29 TRINITY_DN11605_c0_g1_i1:22-1596(-)
MISWEALLSKTSAPFMSHLFEVSRDFYSAEPWNQIISTEQVFELHYTDAKNKNPIKLTCQILGKSQVDTGISLWKNYDDFAKMFLPGFGVAQIFPTAKPLTALFVDESEIDPPEMKLLKKHKWVVATVPNKYSYPQFVRYAREPVVPLDGYLLEACMRCLPDYLQSLVPADAYHLKPLEKTYAIDSESPQHLQKLLSHKPVVTFKYPPEGEKRYPASTHKIATMPGIVANTVGVPRGGVCTIGEGLDYYLDMISTTNRAKQTSKYAYLAYAIANCLWKMEEEHLTLEAIALAYYTLSVDASDRGAVRYFILDAEMGLQLGGNNLRGVLEILWKFHDEWGVEWFWSTVWLYYHLVFRCDPPLAKESELQTALRNAIDQNPHFLEIVVTTKKLSADDIQGFQYRVTKNSRMTGDFAEARKYCSNFLRHWPDDLRKYLKAHGRKIQEELQRDIEANRMPTPLARNQLPPLSLKDSLPVFKVSVCQNCAVAKDAINLKLCSRCKKVYYCSVDCQKAHFKRHKIICYAK